MKKSEMIGFKTTPEIKTKLEQIAKEQERPISWIVNKIITDYITSISTPQEGSAPLATPPED